MKKVIATLAAAAALVALPSCEHAISYLNCMFSSNMQECVAGKSLDAAAAKLAEYQSMTSKSQADDLASKWSTIQSGFEGAQFVGIEIPANLKKSYNDFVNKTSNKKYYESETLKTAMKDARPLK